MNSIQKILTVLIFTIMFLAQPLFATSTAQKKRNDFITEAKDWLGTPYVYGGTTRNGIDCSGFVYVAAMKSGIGVLPRTAAQMYNTVKKIKDSEREPGDLVFFAVNSKVTHVGIYLGNNQFIHAASDGPKTGVIISRLSEKYWKNHYFAAGRVIASAGNIAEETEGTDPSAQKSDTASKKQSAVTQTEEAPVEESSPAKNKAGNSKFYVTTDLALGYSFFEADSSNLGFSDGGIFYKGLSLQTEAGTDLFGRQVAALFRMSYISEEKSENTARFAARFNFPVAVKIYFNKYISAYAGVVLNTERYSNIKPKLRGSDKRITTPFFPGIIGVSFNTPAAFLGPVKLSLAQDISYTHHKAASGNETLTFAEAFASGFAMNTFLRVQWR